MKNIPFIGLYLSFYFLYYLFIVELPGCHHKALCLLEGNSTFNVQFNQIIPLYMFLTTVIHALSIAYISSTIHNLREMKVYIHIRLKRKRETRFYYLTIFQTVLALVLPKFILDGLITGFGDLLLIFIINASLLITLLFYSLIHLSFSLAGMPHKLILLLLIGFLFSSSIAYMYVPIVNLFVFVPHTLYESSIELLIWKLLLLCISMTIFPIIKKMNINQML